MTHINLRSTDASTSERDAAATRQEHGKPAKGELTELSISELDQVTGGVRKSGGTVPASGQAFLTFNFNFG